MSGVYKAISAVQRELAKVGIAKTQKNSQGSGYMFRGIDQVYASLSPLMAEHGLVVIPRMVECNQVERTSSKGGALFYTTVRAEFDFVAVEDGSTHTAATYGEAMDSGDKSTNKAMSAAYKYAAFMTFAIPTEGDNDADNSTHEVASTAMVSADQCAELRRLIAAADVTEDALLDRVKFKGTLPELPATRFEQVKGVLMRRIEANKGNGNAGQ